MSKNLIPNFTQIPNIFLDELLSELSGSEIKVLFYVARRTYGFQKEADRIAVSQIMHGIEGRDGKKLDKGTGLSNRVVIKAIKDLEERKILIAEKEIGKTTKYRINLTYDEASPVTKSHQSEGDEPVTKSHTTYDERSQVPVTKSHTQKKEKESIQNKEHARTRAVQPAQNDPVAFLEKTPKEKALEFFAQGEIYHDLRAKLLTIARVEVVDRELNKFADYWTERNATGKKQRWQQQATFEVERRLRTWLSRSKEYQPEKVTGRKIIA